MPAPAPSASVEVFFEYNEYCSTLLEVDPETKDLEPVVATASDKLSKTVAARTVAQRGVNRTTALRDYTFRGLLSTIEVFERKASAEFDAGEAAPGYRRLFAKTPSQLGKTPIEGRAKVFEEFVAEAQSDETPAALDKPVKLVAAAWASYQTAVKRLAAAQSAFGKAREKEDAAKTDNITALRKLEGKLTDRFSADPKRVRSYFPPPKAARKQPAAPPATAATPVAPPAS